MKKNYNKIHIVGIYGSGKSTLAKELSKLLKIKTYDLDEIKYKRKYDLVCSVKERVKKVNKISKKNFWITEGAWLRNAIELYRKADLVIFLDIPKWIIYKRTLFRHIKRKIRHPFRKQNLRGILRRIHQYFHDAKHFMTLKSHKDYIGKYAKKFVIIKNNNDIKNLIDTLLF